LEVEQSLSKESEDLERSVNKIRNDQYEPLQGKILDISRKNIKLISIFI
jgi:hypothetical protein